MEKLLKRYFWVVHVVLIIATAGLLALAVNNIIGGLLSPFAVMTPPPPAKASPFDKKKPMLARTQEKLWGKDLPPDPATAESTEPVEDEAVTVAEPMEEGEYPIS
jgi:hypothetical protein